MKNFIHRPGVHCDSSALRDVFEYHGFNFTEPMIFGLGSGLSFVYWKTRQMSFPFVGGRIGVLDLDKNLCENLNVSLEIKKTTSVKKAYESLKDFIYNDIPVMVHVDMAYLSYLQLPEEAHFGAHVIVIAGLDEEEGVAYVADTSYENLQKVLLEELEKARSSKFKPFPPQNKYLIFKFPPEMPPIDGAIKRAIDKTVDFMLKPPIKNLGIKGIRHLANEIMKWPRDYTPKKFHQGYEMTYVMLEEAGTGGGCFRYLYSRFLNEASEILKNEDLSILSDKYHKVGEKWTDVAYMIRSIPEGEDTTKIKNLILEIADDEENTLSSLGGILS